MAKPRPCLSVLYASLAAAATSLPGAWRTCWIMRMAHTTCSVKAYSKWAWRHSAEGIAVWPHTGTIQCPHCDPQNPTGHIDGEGLVCFEHSVGCNIAELWHFPTDNSVLNMVQPLNDRHLAPSQLTKTSGVCTTAGKFYTGITQKIRKSWKSCCISEIPLKRVNLTYKRIMCKSTYFRFFYFLNFADQVLQNECVATCLAFPLQADQSQAG